MHAGVAFEDAAKAVTEGRLGDAAKLLFRRTVAQSLRSAITQVAQVSKLASWKRSRKRVLAETPAAPARVHAPGAAESGNAVPS
jgi:hypothetical protein